VFLELAAQPEQFAVGRGELFLESADRFPAGVAFVAKLCREDMHDVVATGISGLCRSAAGGGAGLLGAQFLDALPDVVVSVEEVEADSGGAGD
jgi:hypothetical protein